MNGEFAFTQPLVFGTDRQDVSAAVQLEVDAFGFRRLSVVCLTNEKVERATGFALPRRRGD